MKDCTKPMGKKYIFKNNVRRLDHGYCNITEKKFKKNT